jgi:hypothetical protein
MRANTNDPNPWMQNGCMMVLQSKGSTDSRNRWRYAVLFAALAATAPSGAQDAWKTEPVAAATMAADIIPEKRQPAPYGLPDGLVATYEGGDIRAAWYTEPTSRYRHGILGDGIEAGALIVETSAGLSLNLVLPGTEVFEDRYPRLADLDGDGSVEVITIRSSLSKGASVAVYGLKDGVLAERASTGYIGRSNRWLNIAGIADFDGQDGQEIAFVRTPHIGGTLFFYQYRNGSLSEIAAIDGFSNHVIGSREMRLSAITDVNGDGLADIALPSDSRRHLRIVGFEDGNPVDLAVVPLPGRIDRAIAVDRNGSTTGFVVGLDDGSVFRIWR